VDRGVLGQIVGDVEADVLAFLEPDERPRHRAIDRNPVAFAPLHHARAVAHGKVDYIARNLIKARPNGRAALHAVHAVALRPRGERGTGRSSASACKQATSGEKQAGHVFYIRISCPNC
jgi:hypothetical protein